MINTFNKYSKDIEKVVLFGSRGRGDYKSCSDIDLAIKFRDGSKIYQIKEDLLQQNIIYTFDVIDYNKIDNENLYQAVAKEGKVIFTTDAEGGVVLNINTIKVKVGDLEKALLKLEKNLTRDYKEDDIVIDATIKRFEFSYEQAWKLMKAYLEYNGNLNGASPRRAIQESFKEGLIDDGEGWLAMLQDHNLTTHTYDEKLAIEIYENVKYRYLLLLSAFLEKIKKEVTRMEKEELI